MTVNKDEILGYAMSVDIYNLLHDFVMQHEEDIELEINDFGLLKEIYEWICKLEGYDS